MDDTLTNDSVTKSTLFNYLVYSQKCMAWFMMIFLIFGNIGNLFNCLVFLQKSLRSNSCSWYLLISSIINTIALTFVIPLNIYSVEKTNPSTYSLIYCKLRLYIYHTLLMMSRYLIIFACIDRACLSSRQASIRNFSQMRNARIISISTIIFWFIAAIHLPLMSTIKFNYCTMSSLYALIFGIYALIFAGLIPPILMSIFSLITVRNLHSIHVRIHPLGNQPNRLMRQRDFQLTRMLTTQVIVYILTTTPYPLNAFYVSITSSVIKSVNRQIIELFIYFITGTFLVFINPSITFYIYITTSKAFRTEFKSVWRKCFCANQNNGSRTNFNRRFVPRIFTQQQQGGFQTSSATVIK